MNDTIRYACKKCLNYPVQIVVWSGLLLCVIPSLTDYSEHVFPISYTTLQRNIAVTQITLSTIIPTSKCEKHKRYLRLR